MSSQHTVQQGDCLSSIAAQYGVAWDKIWNDSANADLKQKRQDPNVLLPGDSVAIPDPQEKVQACAVDARHRFKVRRAPVRIKIRLTIDDQPRPGLSYELQVDGKAITGAADSSGYIEAEIAPKAGSGVLKVTDGDVTESYDLAFGMLDPLDVESGVRGRLAALGHLVDDLAAAVRGFQSKEGIEATGAIDDALKSRVKEKFGQ